MIIIMQNVFLRLLIPVIVLFTVSCSHDYTPKPRGYMRIEFPEKSYQTYVPENCPFQFDIPAYAKVEPDLNRFAEPCWMNMVFSRFRAEVNLSYKPVHGNLNKFIEDCRTLAYKHTVKADAIDEKRIMHERNQVYGLLYEIGGDAASSVQFYVTDSVSHFIRGALYFNAPPRRDSLAPVIDFLEQDIRNLIMTLTWK